MPSRRDQIKMSADERAQFLDEEKTLTCATVGIDGRPHLMPLWFVRDGAELRGWTFAKSQKTKNLERDPHATIQVEAGVDYQDLRGVMMECDVVVVREVEAVADHGMELFERYGGTSELPPETRDMVLAQAPKRVGLCFIPTRVVSWDHRKLGGVY
ncbi:MAG: pyridoxamine 5'-phosphate oxidase family protein [Thermoleophilaceae bacterium]|nr:pyridoxamine 5'-phosphate oxidase family protein [Thermoleophilaceae bacterium]